MRDLDAGAEIRKISANENLPIYPTMLNVDHDDSVREGFAKIVGQHGPIDILVNNAGIGGGGAVEETPLDVFREVMETNFFGGLRCIKTVITSMRERRQGTIVNVTSIAGRLAMTPQASYAASKWAFEALSECLAQKCALSTSASRLWSPGSSPLRSSQKRALFCRIARIRILSASGPCSPRRSPSRLLRLSSPT
jgi:NAD(P)-dependent dehydrogenase (short-subunit alcohol dehydrogenase family)